MNGVESPACSWGYKRRGWVAPDDNARVPVLGRLRAAGDGTLVIHRRDPRAGNLHIHFPRLGFEVLPA